MRKAVAYYRTRPSEPEASEVALGLQREAVRKEIERSEYELFAEFTEREGEDGSESYPAYRAAVEAASALSGSDGFMNSTLFVAGHAAIGSGGIFKEPHIEGQHRGFMFMEMHLTVGSSPAPQQIEMPAGAPGHICLYADCQPRQSETLIYLCNAGPEALTQVAVVTTSIDIQQFFSQPRGERWSGGSSYTIDEQFEAVPAKCGVLVASVGHYFMEFVCRYQVAYTDANGRRCAVEANDWQLLNTHPRNEAQQTWVALQSEPA